MKKDVRDYYNKCTKQYHEMLETVNALEKEKGNVNEETLKFLANQVEIMKVNCDRLGYILYLLAMPPFRLFNRKETDRDIIKYFRSVKADRDSVLKENKAALKAIKSYIKVNGK